MGNDHLTSMYISWGTDLDPKGANSQVREASDLLINHSVVPDIGKRPLYNTKHDFFFCFDYLRKALCIVECSTFSYSVWVMNLCKPIFFLKI